MASKKPNRKRKQQRAGRQAFAEDRRAEVVTVAWMLCVMATLLAEIVGGVVRLVSTSLGSVDLPQTVRAMPGLMLLSALMTGILSLILLPLAYHFRRTRPPPIVTVFSATVALVPLIICFFFGLR